MAKNANINIRIDPATKRAAEQLFSNFGITITDAVNIFLHQSLLTGGLPFVVKLPEPNTTTLATMKEIESMITAKTSASPQTVDDFFKEMELDADC
jgi:DNA-damage-inducible protein J